MKKDYGKVWLWFFYFWVICGIGIFVGQFIPPGIRLIISVVLLVVILGSLLFKRGRRWGAITTNIYALAIGIISYGSFMYFFSDLGADLFFKNVMIAIAAFLAFGLIGFFVIKDASGMGKYLFVILIALIVASLVGLFIHNPIFHTILTVIGLGLFLMYTIYDFNRMRRGDFQPMEMGFNLFINLLNIILDVLRLASIINK